MALTTLANVKTYLGISGTDNDALITALVTRASSAIEKYCSRYFESTEYREFHDGDGSSELSLDNYPVINITMLGVGKTEAFSISNTSTDAYHAFVSVTDTTIQLKVQGGSNEDDTSLTLADYSTLSLLIAAITALDKGWQMIGVDAVSYWSAIELLPTSKGLRCLDSYTDLYLPEEPAEEYTTDSDAGMIKLWGAFCSGYQNVVVRYTAGYATVPGDLEQICIDLVAYYYNQRNINSALKKEKLGDYAYENFAGDESRAGNILPIDITSRLQPWRSRSI